VAEAKTVMSDTAAYRHWLIIFYCGNVGYSSISSGTTL